MADVHKAKGTNNALDFDPREALRLFFDNSLELYVDWQSRRLDLYLDREGGILICSAGIELPLYASWLVPTSDRCKRRGKESDLEKLRQVLAAVGYERYESAFSKLGESAIFEGQRGRPRTQGLNALRAYVGCCIERRSLREITLPIKGSCRSRKCPSYCATCGDVARSTRPGRYDKHLCETCGYRKRPPQQREKICPKCADSTKKSVLEFLRFLGSQYIIPHAWALKGSGRKLKAINLPE